jgi:hypothetical protein
MVFRSGCTSDGLSSLGHVNWSQLIFAINALDNGPSPWTLVGARRNEIGELTLWAVIVCPRIFFPFVTILSNFVAFQTLRNFLKSSESFFLINDELKLFLLLFLFKCQKFPKLFDFLFSLSLLSFSDLLRAINNHRAWLNLQASVLFICDFRLSHRALLLLVLSLSCCLFIRIWVLNIIKVNRLLRHLCFYLFYIKDHALRVYDGCFVLLLVRPYVFSLFGRLEWEI